MISELLIHWFKFTDVWYAHPGKLRHAILWGGRWHVGFYNYEIDLICVKRCKTNEEGELYLSPGSRTILGATIKAILKLRRIRNGT